MSSFAAHILVSTLRSRLLAGGVVAGFLAVTLIPSFSVAAPVEDSIPQLGSRDFVLTIPITAKFKMAVFLRVGSSGPRS